LELEPEEDNKDILTFGVDIEYFQRSTDLAADSGSIGISFYESPSNLYLTFFSPIPIAKQTRFGQNAELRRTRC